MPQLLVIVHNLNDDRQTLDLTLIDQHERNLSLHSLEASK